MSSCERPSNSSGSSFGPSSVANLYSFSTGSHGSSRRCSSTRLACSSSSRSAPSSPLRAACHSCSVPIFIGPPSVDLVLVRTVRRRKTHRKAERLEQLRQAPVHDLDDFPLNHTQHLEREGTVLRLAGSPEVDRDRRLQVRPSRQE